jgi:hypothetical protein
MGKHLFGLCVMVAACWQAVAAERVFDFTVMAVNQPPPGFRSAVGGEGKPGDWRMILDEVPPLLAPLSSNAPVVTKRAVLAQLAPDKTDEHFPLLIFDGEVYTDFTFTTRFKTVGGEVEQMAGVVFRLQDEKNFYVVRASSLGNNVRFYKVVNGERGAPIGPDVAVPRGAWHELTVVCKGNQIRCQLDGQEIIPPLTDNTFMRGKLGFWTKSDAVSYFVDAKVTYVPQERPAQVLVRDLMKRYPRLVGIKIFALSGEPSRLQVIASSQEKEVGQPGGKAEQDVLDKGTMYYGKGDATVSVTMPLRDRNGEPVAAARVTMKSFLGQTEQNAIIRAKPIVNAMQARIQDAKDLFE